MILSYILLVIFTIVPFASADRKRVKFVRYVRIIRPTQRIIIPAKNKSISTMNSEIRLNGNAPAKKDVIQTVTKRKRIKSVFKTVTDITTPTATLKSPSTVADWVDSFTITETKSQAQSVITTVVESNSETTVKRDPVISAEKTVTKRNPVKSAAKTVTVSDLVESATRTTKFSYLIESATRTTIYSYHTDFSSKTLTYKDTAKSVITSVDDSVDDTDTVKSVVTSSAYTSRVKSTTESTSVVDSNPLKLPVINRKLANPKSSSDNLGEDEKEDPIVEPHENSSQFSGDNRPLFNFTILSVTTWIAAFYLFF